MPKARFSAVFRSFRKTKKVIEHMSDYLFDYLLILNTEKALENQGLPRAADGNRTRDLRTTNATLYRLSHSSIS